MGYKEACEYFGHKKGDGMILHHKDKSLKYRDPVRYNEWRIEDLVMITKAEHNAIHNPDKEYDHHGEKNPMYGVHRYGEASPTWGKVWTEEERKHASDAQYKSYKEHPERFDKPEGFNSGSKNPMYGSEFFWVNDGTTNYRWPLDMPIKEGLTKGMVKKKCLNLT